MKTLARWFPWAFAASFALYEVGRVLGNQREAAGEPWPVAAWWVVTLLPMATVLTAAWWCSRNGKGS